MSNFIKYLTDIRAHFTIKNRIAKKKSYISITIRPIIFFKSIIRLIQIFRGANSYFCRLNFENIKIIIYFLENFQNFEGLWQFLLDTIHPPTKDNNWHLLK